MASRCRADGASVPVIAAPAGMRRIEPELDRKILGRFPVQGEGPAIETWIDSGRQHRNVTATTAIRAESTSVNMIGPDSTTVR